MQAATPWNLKRRARSGGDPFARLDSDPPRSLRVVTSIGIPISALVYEPEGAIHGNVLVHSATACPQRFYESFARHLARSGLRVFTYDYRGIGKSRSGSLRGASVTMADWALIDARAMHAYIEAHYPGMPLAILGHSFGGQLVGLLDEARQASAAVFVGAQLGYYGFWPEPQASLLRNLWKYVVPGLCGVLGYFPKQSGMGEDLPQGVALQWARWCSSPDYLISEFPEARDRFAAFDRPVLSYSFSDDAYAPARAVDALYGLLPAARVTSRRIRPSALGAGPIGHFGFFRPRVGAKLWDETADYLLAALREPDLPATA
jgi:predicted alpha/beta hydrolase